MITLLILPHIIIIIIFVTHCKAIYCMYRVAIGSVAMAPLALKGEITNSASDHDSNTYFSPEVGNYVLQHGHQLCYSKDQNTVHWLRATKCQQSTMSTWGRGGGAM